jgi:hypothetical protein
MPVSLIYMFVRMLLGALLPAVGTMPPRNLRSSSSVIRWPALAFVRLGEEPRADRIDVPGGRVAQDLRSFGSYTNRTIYG